MIRLDPSFLDLVNTPDTNVLFSVTFVMATMFFLLSNAASFFTINSSSCQSGNANLELDFGVSIWSSFSPFSVISRIILSLVTFFHLFKWFLRFASLKFWISLFRNGIISCWNFKIVVVPNLLQISFSCGNVSVNTPLINVTSGFGGAVAPLVLISRASWKSLQVFFFNFYSEENKNRSPTFFDLSQWCLSYHLSFYLTEILMVQGHL